MKIIQLNEITDIEILAGIAREEGFGFLDRLVREWADGTNRFDKEGEALFGAMVGDRLLGTAGLTYQSEGIGRVRRVYVHPEVRRQGVGELLARAVLEKAKEHFSTVVLFTDNPAAATFYEALGFKREDFTSPYRSSHRFDLRESNH